MKKLLYAVLALFVVAPLSVSAATFKAGETVIQNDALEDDLYATGENITLHSDLAGDLFGAAGIIMLTGAVQEDVFISGGTVTVGDVGDDVRAAGGTITFNGEIGDDVFVAGGTIIFGAESAVLGDLHVGAGNLSIDSTVSGSAKIGAGVAQLNGVLTGPTRVDADRIVVNGRLEGDVELAAQSISIAEDAEIAGTVRYWQQDGEIQAGSALVEGGSLAFDESLQSRVVTSAKSFWPASLFMLVMFLLSGALVILVLVLADKKDKFENGARTLSTHYWKSLLTGLIFLIVTPVVGAILSISVIGLPLGLLVLVLYGFLVFFLPMIAALTLARWVDLRRTKQFNRWIIYLIALGAYVLVTFVGYIPFVGILAQFMLYPAVLGALVINRRARAKERS